ncbi:MAG: hypothetical protein Q8M76_09515 [Spirochaetaceae bacterium]|nr:hypothetical protein [Spirochaetaceae bacterium]
MSEKKVQVEALTRAALALFDEAYLEAPNPRMTWFTDNEPRNGFLGTIGSLSAAEASRPLTPGDPLTVASHAAHLRFSLNLANRAVRGENAFEGAVWARSWEVRTVGEPEWKELIAALRAEYAAFREALASGEGWADETMMTGAFGLIAHGAWHLGAIRQGLGLVKAPAK